MPPVASVGGGRTLPLQRRVDATDPAYTGGGASRRSVGSGDTTQKRLRCLPPPPPPPRGFYWLQHQQQQQQLMQNDQNPSSSTSSSPPPNRRRTSYASATLPAPDSRAGASRDHQRAGGGHLGRAVASPGGHSSGDDALAGSSSTQPRVYQISPGASSSTLLTPSLRVAMSNDVVV